MSIGGEGKVKCWSMYHQNDLVWEYTLIWNSVSCVAYITDEEILVGNFPDLIRAGNELYIGLSNGSVQMLFVNWDKPELIRYTLYEFHNSPIKHIATLSYPEKKVFRSSK